MAKELELGNAVWDAKMLKDSAKLKSFIEHPFCNGRFSWIFERKEIWTPEPQSLMEQSALT